jgi:AraC-like DNA-binding protein
MARYEPSLLEWEKMARVAHYHQREIAKLRGLSPRHLRRRFRESFGRSLREWLVELRLKDVERLLLTTDVRLKDAALSACFNHNTSFTRWFKTHKGFSPSALEPRISSDGPSAQCTEGGLGM